MITDKDSNLQACTDILRKFKLFEGGKPVYPNQTSPTLKSVDKKYLDLFQSEFWHEQVDSDSGFNHQVSREFFEADVKFDLNICKNNSWDADNVGYLLSDILKKGLKSIAIIDEVMAKFINCIFRGEKTEYFAPIGVYEDPFTRKKSLCFLFIDAWSQSTNRGNTFNEMFDCIKVAHLTNSNKAVTSSNNQKSKEEKVAKKKESKSARTFSKVTKKNTSVTPSNKTPMTGQIAAKSPRYIVNSPMSTQSSQQTTLKRKEPEDSTISAKSDQMSPQKKFIRVNPFIQISAEEEIEIMDVDGSLFVEKKGDEGITEEEKNAMEKARQKSLDMVEKERQKYLEMQLILKRTEEVAAKEKAAREETVRRELELLRKETEMGENEEDMEDMEKVEQFRIADKKYKEQGLNPNLQNHLNMLDEIRKGESNVAEDLLNGSPTRPLESLSVEEASNEEDPQSAKFLIGIWNESTTEETAEPVQKPEIAEPEIAKPEIIEPEIIIPVIIKPVQESEITKPVQELELEPVVKEEIQRDRTGVTELKERLTLKESKKLADQLIKNYFDSNSTLPRPTPSECWDGHIEPTKSDKAKITHYFNIKFRNSKTNKDGKEESKIQ